VKKANIDKLIHGIQIGGLALLGMSIYAQETLTGWGISHPDALVYSLWGLAISLAYEHFMMK